MVRDYPILKDVFSSLKFLDNYERIYLGFSGWADSSLCLEILLEYLWKNQNKLILLHFKHNIRNDSLNEIEAFHQKFPAIRIISDLYTGFKKDENTLRNARYLFFKKYVNKNDLLILAHNLDDRIEWFFINSLRGASLKWLSNMTHVSEQENITIFRPLLKISKQNILNIVHEQKILYIHDYTNDDTTISTRNLIRHEVIAKLSWLANISNNWVNKFYQSFQDLFENIEKKGDAKNLLTPVKTSKYWNFGTHTISGYEIIADLNEQNVSDILHYVWENTRSKKFIAELLRFLENSSSGHKTLSKSQFIISNSKIYLFLTQDCFYKKTIEESIEITRLWKHSIGDFIWDITDSSFIWANLCFPLPEDKYKDKRIQWYLSKKKIPLFWRNYTPVIKKNDKIIAILNITEQLWTL